MSANSSRLKKEANMLTVIQYLYGGHIIRKGDAYFINCPNPAHDDKHASCYTKNGWKNITCTSCGYYSESIDLLMLEKGIDFPEACDTLWEIEGCPSWYKEVKFEKKNTNKKELSPDELALLSLTGWESYLQKEDLKIIAFEKCRKMYERYKRLHDDDKALQVNRLAKKVRSL